MKRVTFEFCFFFLFGTHCFLFLFIFRYSQKYTFSIKNILILMNSIKSCVAFEQEITAVWHKLDTSVAFTLLDNNYFRDWDNHSRWKSTMKQCFLVCHFQWTMTSFRSADFFLPLATAQFEPLRFIECK